MGGDLKNRIFERVCQIFRRVANFGPFFRRAKGKTRRATFERVSYTGCFQCPILNIKRDNFISKITQKYQNFHKLNPDNKFIFLMSVEEQQTCQLFAKFIYDMNVLRKSYIP